MKKEKKELADEVSPESNFEPNLEETGQVSEKVFNCIPPFNFKRNEFGLLEHIDYVFNEDGTVNWRKMIPPEYLFPNKKLTSETDVSKIEDSKLIIKLGGLSYLAQLRGFTSVSHKEIFADPSFVSIKTCILWIGNYETNNESVMFESLADASLRNTFDFGKMFLSAFAENRGFGRAVRRFLNINIVAQEELGPELPKEDTTENSTGQPQETLESLLKKNNIPFDSFKNRMVANGVEGAEDWDSVKSIPTHRIFELIDITKRRIEEKSKKS